MANVKFGKLPPKVDPRTLMVEDYFSVPQPVLVPPEVHWAAKVPQWGPMENDEIGDCTLAMVGHAIQCWTSNVAPYNMPPDSEIVKAYSAISGYNPATGANDTGCYLLDVLNYSKKTGVGVNHHKLTAFAGIRHWTPDTIKRVIYLFGAAYIGIACPQSALDQFDAHQPWTSVTGPTGTTIAGGHAIPLFGYDADWAYFVTWGKPKKLAWSWLSLYMDEGYAPLSADWIASNGTAVNGFNLAQLLKDLKQIGPTG